MGRASPVSASTRRGQPSNVPRQTSGLRGRGRRASGRGHADDWDTGRPYRRWRRAPAPAPAPAQCLGLSLQPHHACQFLDRFSSHVMLNHGFQKLAKVGDTLLPRMTQSRGLVRMAVCGAGHLAQQQLCLAVPCRLAVCAGGC